MSSVILETSNNLSYLTINIIDMKSEKSISHFSDIKSQLNNRHIALFSFLTGNGR